MKNLNSKLSCTFILVVACIAANSSWGADEAELARTLLNQPINTEPQTLDPNTPDGPKLDGTTKQSIAFESNLNTAVRDVKLKNTSKSRGAAEAAIYDQISAGTVLIVAGDGLGSGALITDTGYIITNQHVVGKAKEVAVFFKPAGTSTNLNRKDAVLGKVTKINEFKDLALIKVDAIPSSARPIAITSGSPRVGEDAHAIGHPKGEYWTYTRGYVSAVRDNYQWSEGKNSVKREAKIVQTQTPINPGNSGGPLVDDQRKLIGINSFMATNSPGLNYAVSADDVKQFISQEGSRTASTASKQNCGDNIYGKGKDKDKDGPYDYIAYDTKCSGRIDMLLKVPLDKTKPIVFLVDTNDDGKWDVIVMDTNRDGKWDISYHDSNHDGKIDLIGKHPDGKAVPTTLEKIS